MRVTDRKNVQPIIFKFHPIFRMNVEADICILSHIAAGDIVFGPAYDNPADLFHRGFCMGSEVVERGKFHTVVALKKPPNGIGTPG